MLSQVFLLGVLHVIIHKTKIIINKLNVILCFVDGHMEFCYGRCLHSVRCYLFIKQNFTLVLYYIVSDIAD